MHKIIMFFINFLNGIYFKYSYKYLEKHLKPFPQVPVSEPSKLNVRNLISAILDFSISKTVSAPIPKFLLQIYLINSLKFILFSNFKFLLSIIIKSFPNP